MSDRHDLAVLNGRSLVHELLLTQLLWQWAKAQGHPGVALEQLCQPVQSFVDQMAANPENDPGAMAAAQDALRSIGQSLEGVLHAEALRRTPQPPGPMS